ncbi:MAG TPA: dipeptidase [Candidatus Heimdallarchaeota archaeon]|nr:dipeptidase [Candidatus Heimdallarchaeota archaeon]
MKVSNKIFLITILLVFVFGMMFCTSQQTEADLATKVSELHDKVLTVDTHADTPSRLLSGDWDIGERHESTGRRASKIDLPRMAEGGLDAEFFAVFVGQGARTPEGYAAAKERAYRVLDAIHKMCEDYPELVALATTPEDAYKIENEGKRAAFIGMENGYPIGRDLSLIEKYYNRGVRYITLCHSGDNDICDSSTDQGGPEDNGLLEFGKEVVAECNRLGIMVDISHASEKSFFDIVETTKAPIIASHSSARALCDHPRNLTDEQLKALAENGGVIQICFVSSFVKEQPPNPERDAAIEALREKYGSRRDIQDEAARAKAMEEYQEVYEKYPGEKTTLQELVDHIDHVVELIGVDHVGIGTDFDGGGGVEGCNDVSEMPNITEELLRRGYSEEEIQKIWGGNIMRVFSRVIEVSERT